MDAGPLIPALLLVYLMPWFVAALRRHHQVNAIGALTILLGWTFIGWAAAFVWALTVVRPEEMISED